MLDADIFAIRKALEGRLPRCVFAISSRKYPQVLELCGDHGPFTVEGSSYCLNHAKLALRGQKCDWMSEGNPNPDLIPPGKEIG